MIYIHFYSADFLKIILDFLHTLCSSSDMKLIAMFYLTLNDFNLDESDIIL